MPRMKFLSSFITDKHCLQALSIATASSEWNSFHRFKGTFYSKRALFRSVVTRMSSTDDVRRGNLSNEAQVQVMRQQLIDDQESNELTSSSVRKNAWDSLWQDNITPWDLGQPTPVLMAELESQWDKTTRTINVEDATSTTNNTTFRSLVPGCGAGYDLVTLAFHHEQWIADASKPSQPNAAVIVGLDISDTSLVERASTVVATGIQNNKKSNNLELKNTRIDLINGDFFKNTTDWNVVRSFGSESEQHSHQEDPTTFDFIFDYTFFCALHPSMRSSWGEQMAKLLTPGTGRLLTIMFPMLPTTANRLDGPPFPVTVEDYRAVLEPRGIVMDERTAHHGDDDTTSGSSSLSSPVRIHPDTVAPRVGKEMVCWWVRSMDSHYRYDKTKSLSDVGWESYARR